MDTGSGLRNTKIVAKEELHEAVSTRTSTRTRNPTTSSSALAFASCPGGMPPDIFNPVSQSLGDAGKKVH